jgi:hypothetical protein
MYKTILLITLNLGMSLSRAQAQISALEQLELDLSKLSELKGSLQDMYSNYQILSQEYGQLQHVAKGNFQLHLAYINSLLEVSAPVQSDPRVTDISTTQAQILQLYQAAYASYSASPYLSPQDKASLDGLYQSMLNQCVQDMGEVNMVLTPGVLSMTDDERLSVLNRLDERMRSRLLMVMALNRKVSLLLMQRGRHASDISNLQKLYGL